MPRAATKPIDPETSAPARSRGRPNAAATIALNNHIIAIAKEMFFSVGFNGATMDAVAQQARISKETLYSRFPNKAELFTAVMKAQLDIWGKAAVKHNPIVTTTTLAEAIHHHVEVHVAAMLSPESIAFSRILMAEMDNFPELARTIFSHTYEGRIVAVADNIRKYAAIDGIPARDPESAAAALRAMVSGWLQSIMAEGRTLSEPERVSFVMRVSELFLASRPAW